MAIIPDVPPELLDGYLEILLHDVLDRARYRGDVDLQLVRGNVDMLAMAYYQFIEAAPAEKSTHLPSSLFTIVRLAYLLGSACPDKMMLEEKIKVAMKAKSNRAQKRREEIIAPLALAVIGSHPKWTDNRIAEKIKDGVNNQLEKKHQVGLSTICKDITVIRKKLDGRT